MPKPRSPRERFPWYPTINCQGCLRDLECLNFCPANVFDWDPATGAPIVARPLDCIPGCNSCAENCKGNSITLPGKKAVAAALKRIRSEEGRRPSSRGTVGARHVVAARRSRQRRAQGSQKSANPSSVITFTTPANKAPK